MKAFRWKVEKNERLVSERGICFEDVAFHIENGGLLDVILNPNQEKYGGQELFIVEINKYIYMVPFQETDEEYFLITIIPTRKLTRAYLGAHND